jgi:hypothetical protein
MMIAIIYFGYFLFMTVVILNISCFQREMMVMMMIFQELNLKFLEFIKFFEPIHYF